MLLKFEEGLVEWDYFDRALCHGPIKTKFKCGHPFIPDNIYIMHKGQLGSVEYVCLECRRSASRERWRKRNPGFTPYKLRAISC